MLGMFIQTESTPNPETLKFLPGVMVMESGTLSVTDSKSAASMPLAGGLFAIDGVTGVFFGSDFVTVTKSEDISWDALKPSILAEIMDFFVSGGKVEAATSALAAYSDAELSDIEKQIVELIETRVRPAVAMDGGDIIYKSFVDGVVRLELHGACSGCPSSSATLKSGIENMLKHYVPEVIAVEAVN